MHDTNMRDIKRLNYPHSMMLILVVDESNRKRREKKGKEGWKEGKGGMRVREGEEDDWVYKRVFTLVQRCIVFKVGHDQLDAPYEELKEALQVAGGGWWWLVVAGSGR